MKRYFATCLATLFLGLTCNNSAAFGQGLSNSTDDLLQKAILLQKASFIDGLWERWRNFFPGGNEPDKIPDDYYQRLNAAYAACSDSPNKPTSLEELTSSSRLLDSRI